MRQFDCPQCGAPVPFETPGAVFAVCQHCQSMVVRKDASVETIGKMADLPPDVTPLQIGARGDHNGRPFRLMGRLRVGWTDGTWNEWYADFGGDRYGWIAETQGFFMISEAAPVPPGFKFDKIAMLGPESSIAIGQDAYRKTDHKKTRVIAGEGELPFIAKPNDEWVGIDLVGPGRKFAGLESDGPETRFYLGLSAQPEEIAWEGLRPVPGWNGEPVPVEKRNTDAVGCPECGGVIQVKAAGLTQSLVCGHCGTLLDAKGSKVAVAQKIEAASRLEHPPLPLGTRGTLKGIEWEIIGCVKRRDQYSQWTEGLLYNPWHGFAWLTEWNGHWNYMRRVLESPDPMSPVFEGRRYKLFAREESMVVAVAGEFYWRVRIGEKSTVADYINPPRILSSEIYPELEEVTWSEGEYISGPEVGAAFGMKNLAFASGVYLNQPNPWATRAPTLSRYAWIATAALLIIQIVGMAGAGKKVVLNQDFTYEKPVAGAPPMPALVSPSFDLDGGQSPARVEAEAAVDNSWIGLDADLVNETTGQTYPADISVEYYHGYDDGNWTEGSQKAGSDIPGVPPGRYHLQLAPDADPALAKMPFHITLKRGGIFWSNFFLCLIAIWIWPLWAKIRNFSFEARRWSESDFTS
ncbi:DUF4178 domain-containing protein [Luteolibacter ambystomatis]|uniref:DUF4178 domain-containing protein n=1 Tax=Luteolibacter ambystomatis TaxID=2824561 RepID=A0A975IY75_9BACT|nr:DUF4178 domain-containing protein [Luteolibacter ambystomatis]QUE50101.1 DUF4178 domain-containing protein [Luteolibacter ambystomatis]